MTDKLCNVKTGHPILIVLYDKICEQYFFSEKDRAKAGHCTETESRLEAPLMKRNNQND